MSCAQGIGESDITTPFSVAYKTKFLLYQVDRITGENEKFAENNKILQEQNNQFIENNEKLTLTVTELREQADKCKEIYQRLLKENEKLARIRDGLQEQLNVGFSGVFNQLLSAEAVTRRCSVKEMF